MTGRVRQAADPTQAAAPQAPPAEGGWFDCHLNMAGPAENGAVYLHLRDTDGAFEHWFQAVESVKALILSTALTAIAHELTVTVHLSSTAEYGTVNRLYAKR